jgi:hypothetical protein
VSNRCDGPGPRFFAVLIACLDLQAYVVDGGSADNLPVGALTWGRTLLSSQTDPRKQEPRPTLRQQDTLAREVRVLSSQASVQPSTLREPSPARAPKIQHRERFPGKHSRRCAPPWPPGPCRRSFRLVEPVAPNHAKESTRRRPEVLAIRSDSGFQLIARVVWRRPYWRCSTPPAAEGRFSSVSPAAH